MEEKLSGQLADPGRERQQANEQDPSGQTGVQVGRIDGKPVSSGVPQSGNEPNTMKVNQEEDKKRLEGFTPSGGHNAEQRTR